MSLLTAAPLPEAYRASPMTVDEIDAHPFAARIWATILEVRRQAEDVEEANREMCYTNDDLEAEIAEKFCAVAEQIERIIDDPALGDDAERISAIMSYVDSLG